MRRFSLVLFFTLLIATVAFIVGTFEQLPLRVATHFGAAGRSSGWMTRDGYIASILGFGTLFPLFIVSLITGLPHLTSRPLKIPNRDYWLAPSRREETVATLGEFGAWIGCLVTVFIAAMHYMILQANASVPPKLPALLFWSVLGITIVAMLLWQALFFLRFRRPL